jgi:hypothetical protein
MDPVGGIVDNKHTISRKNTIYLAYRHYECRSSQKKSLTKEKNLDAVTGVGVFTLNPLQGEVRVMKRRRERPTSTQRGGL